MASVLVIDDDPEIRTVLRRVLERVGYQVQEAENGKIGLEVYASAPGDVVIVDLFMPETDGLETTARLRKFAHPPEVIAISGHAAYAETFLHAAQKLGALRVLLKPFCPEELLDAVALGILKRHCSA